MVLHGTLLVLLLSSKAAKVNTLLLITRCQEELKVTYEKGVNPNVNNYGVLPNDYEVNLVKCLSRIRHT
jgi:hypothetical protein